MPTKRYTNFKDARGKVHRCKLDTTNGSGLFMEVKGGRQDFTWRSRRQALIDKRSMDQDPSMKVRWEFWVRKDRSEVSPDLLSFLDGCGIKYNIRVLPKGF